MQGVAFVDGVAGGRQRGVVGADGGEDVAEVGGFKLTAGAGGLALGEIVVLGFAVLGLAEDLALVGDDVVPVLFCILGISYTYLVAVGVVACSPNVGPNGPESGLLGSSIAAGTVASLSFDLIGFGRDDAATIAALINDLNADQPGFLPMLVTGAVHGQVTVNADGAFGYTPEQNWFGADSPLATQY